MNTLKQKSILFSFAVLVFLAASVVAQHEHGRQMRRREPATASRGGQIDGRLDERRQLL